MTQKEAVAAAAKVIDETTRAEDIAAFAGEGRFIVIMRRMPDAETARAHGRRLCRTVQMALAATVRAAEENENVSIVTTPEEFDKACAAFIAAGAPDGAKDE